MQEQDLSEKLRELMDKLGIKSFAQLAKKAGVSKEQVRNIYQGKIKIIRLDSLLKISNTLDISIADLINQFTDNEQLNKNDRLLTIEQEYEQLTKKLAEQRSQLIQEFQKQTIDRLESYLTYWPTAVFKVKENPQMLANKIINLTKPIDQLMMEWEVKTIAQVGDQLPYNPQEHQLIEGVANPGDLVIVRYTGYRQGERLLFRAKVALI